MTKCRANWGALPEGAMVSIFDVVNTSFRHLFVIAPDGNTAMAIARSANHILSTHEIHEDHYFRAPHEIDPATDKNLEPFRAVVELAIARRLQGTLHFDQGQLLVGDEVISP